jgi:hypothetical protein
MTIKYTTKPNINGVRYTLTVDHENKKFHYDHNDAWTYSNHITITKKDREKIMFMLIESGYIEF